MRSHILERVCEYQSDCFLTSDYKLKILSKNEVHQPPKTWHHHLVTPQWFYQNHRVLHTFSRTLRPRCSMDSWLEDVRDISLDSPWSELFNAVRMRSFWPVVLKLWHLEVCGSKVQFALRAPAPFSRSSGTRFSLTCGTWFCTPQQTWSLVKHMQKEVIEQMIVG